jgi:endonuclease YncB( thermonuclease family)
MAAVVAATTAAATPRDWACKLTHIVDGDTLYARCDGERVKVRLLRIDTPEHGQAGFAEAGTALGALIGDQPIRFEFEKPGVPVTDEWGRWLVYVHAGDRNLNVEMVRLGWSRFWTKYGAGRYADDFRRAEREAREAKRGMWAHSSDPVAPASSSTTRGLVADACRPRAECCRVCTRGSACGDACISASAECERDAAGCACDAEQLCASSR